tara:strand:+ start:435 stop:764 length:330 start_codon:yes stop_codon:yes gene_type:complete
MFGYKTGNLMFGMMLMSMIFVSSSILIDGYNNSTECKLCETLVDMVGFEFYHLNKTIDAIFKITEGICETIPGPGAKECIFIADCLDQIVRDLNCSMNATQICHNMTLC